MVSNAPVQPTRGDLAQLATLGGNGCPVCANEVATAIDAGDFRLYSCRHCGSWCSDALYRKAELSFDNSNYFENDDADDDKWLDLLRRVDRGGQLANPGDRIHCGDALVTGGRLKQLVRRTHDAHHLVFFSRKGLSILAQSAILRISERWFDRLALARMDGSPLFTAATATLLSLENAVGNGLFVNLLMKARTDS
jgi:hypothetical protein